MKTDPPPTLQSSTSMPNDDPQPVPGTATINLPRHRPGDQVFFRNGRSILLGMVSHVEAFYVGGDATPVPEDQPGVWIWSYGILGWGNGYLEPQLKKAPSHGRLREISWYPAGTGIDLEVWPFSGTPTAIKTTDPAQPGSPV